jgi:hypothetical protein
VKNRADTIDLPCPVLRGGWAIAADGPSVYWRMKDSVDWGIFHKRKVLLC